MKTVKINAYEKYVPIIGSRLFQLALDWSQTMPETKKAGLEVIQGVKGRKKIPGGLQATYDAVAGAAETIIKARKLHHPTNSSSRQGRKPVLLPKGTLEERLQRATRKWLLNAMINNVDLSVAGDETYDVVLTRDPTKVRAGASTWKDFSDQYRGAYKGWAKTAMRFTAIVPHDWLTRVWRRNLEETGGLITLDAQELDCRIEGVEVFAATWMRQGRGKSVVLETGFIARTDDEQVSCHGATYSSALAGLARKRRLAIVGAGEVAREAVERFAERWAKRSDLVATLADAEAIGACSYGIQSWCHASGLSAQLEVGRATVAELAQAYRVRPLPEVRSTILFASRRSEVALAA